MLMTLAKQSIYGLRRKYLILQTHFMIKLTFYRGDTCKMSRLSRLKSETTPLKYLQLYILVFPPDDSIEGRGSCGSPIVIIFHALWTYLKSIHF